MSWADSRVISCLFKVSVVKCIEFLCRHRRRRLRPRPQQRREQGAPLIPSHPFQTSPNGLKNDLVCHLPPPPPLRPPPADRRTGDRPRPGCRQNHITYLPGRTDGRREKKKEREHLINYAAAETAAAAATTRRSKLKRRHLRRREGDRRRRRDDM